MTGIITSLPPLVEQPPGSNSSNPAGLPGVTYTVAVLNLPQTWTAQQTFSSAVINGGSFSGTLGGATGLPIATGVSGLGTGVGTFLATPSSANLLSAVTGSTGTGSLMFNTAPVLSGTITGTYTLGGTPTLTAPTINGATLTGTIDHSSLLHFDTTNFLQVGTANFGGSSANAGLWIHNGTLSIETNNANLPPSDKGGIHIGMPTAKDVAASGGYGTIKIFSNNINTPEAYLQGTIALITDPTATTRRLKIECIEQGTASRNVTLNENGGNVGVGVVTPLGKFHVNEGVNKNLIFDTTGITVTGAVGMSAVNDAFSANIPLEVRASQTVFSIGSVAIGNLTPAGYLTLAGGAAGAGNAPIKLTSGTNLTTPEAGAVEWNGTNLFVTQTTGPTRKQIAYAETPLSAVLGADVLLNNTANFFDVVSVAQGTAGTWQVTAQCVVIDTSAAATFFAKLWDGTNLIASGLVTTTGANLAEQINLSGIITGPAGNLRMSLRDVNSVNGKALASGTGLGKDCTIFAVRIG